MKSDDKRATSMPMLPGSGDNTYLIVKNYMIMTAPFRLAWRRLARAITWSQIFTLTSPLVTAWTTTHCLRRSRKSTAHGVSRAFSGLFFAFNQMDASRSEQWIGEMKRSGWNHGEVFCETSIYRVIFIYSDPVVSNLKRGSEIDWEFYITHLSIPFGSLLFIVSILYSSFFCLRKAASSILLVASGNLHCVSY